LADGREAQLIGGDRNRVVWVGRQIPEELQEAVKVLGLSDVDAVRNLERFDVSAADLFAVFVSAVGNDVDKALGRLLRLLRTMHVLDYGVLLGTVSPDSAKAITLRRLLLDKFGNDRVEIAGLGLTRDDFASALRSHQAGPPANPNLRPPLPGHDQDYDLHDYESDAILLQRAFSGFTNITLIPEEGGHSKDCKVWRIYAYRDKDTYEPFVAKAAKRMDLQAEFETYCDFVRDFVPFPFRAPLLEARFVKGATRAILVSAFVGRSQRLDKYLAASSSPELVMVSLFDGALGRWRREATSEHSSLGHIYIEQQKAAKSNATDARANSLLPDPEGLTAAFEKGRKVDNLLPAPPQLWDQLDKLPRKEHFSCRVHGDLNVRNVFVRWNSIDTILIDFSRSGIRESLARDPSKLDTSISLTARNSKGKLLPVKILRRLYRGRLLPPRNLVTFDGRTDAICQIRRHAAGEGVSSDEYETLTICHLLRFACEPVNKERDTVEMQNRRALSYRLACGLLRNLSEYYHEIHLS
jgi:Arc/MetJ family transcription regulator